ncbi:MAG: outer membrane protein [Verrucomicrobiota bacterium]|jgi:outer membrane protein
MKKFLLLALTAGLAFPVAALAQSKVGTVDMNRAFKEYSKTKDAEKKINEARDAAKKEYDDRAESYKKALDEINKLNQQLDSPALSADKKTSMAKERDEKIASIKTMEREISEFRQTRERQLQEQMKRMLEGLVKEITDIVLEKVKTNKMDFVFDKSGTSMSGVPMLIYANESTDFTTEVIATLNKGAKPTADKPAASPATATSPAATAVKSPAKP